MNNEANNVAVNTNPNETNANAVTTGVEPVTGETVNNNVEVQSNEFVEKTDNTVNNMEPMTENVEVATEVKTEAVQVSQAETSTEVTTEAVATENKNDKKTEAPTEAALQPHNPKVNDQVIYEMKPEKDGSVFGIILFFGLIFVFVFFLPEVSDYVTKIFPTIGIKQIKKTKPEETEKEKPIEQKKPEEEMKLYDIDSLVSDAKIDNLSLGNFVKDNSNGQVIKFYLLNNNDESFTFDDKTKFFIDFYDNKTYLSSVLVFTYDAIGIKESKDFSLPIPNNVYQRANKFALVRKNTINYPETKLKKTDGDYKILTCTRGNTNIDYYFLDNYLEKIEETYTENNTAPTYATDLEQYKNNSSKYQKYNAIDYDVIESVSNFMVKTNIELKNIEDAELEKLTTYRFFPYHKESKVVSYEMQTSGYTCS